MSITDISPFVYPANRSMHTESFDACTLDAADEFFVIVMTVTKTGTLNKIGWKSGTTATAAGFVLKISLETVAAALGAPVATTNAGKTLYAAGAESADITSISASTVYYTAINGSTGISVTKGDRIAITFRMVSITSGAATIYWSQYGSAVALEMLNSNSIFTATYLGSSWVLRLQIPAITLQYSDGFCPLLHAYPICTLGNASYNNSTDPDRRGIKFKLPIGCRIYGVTCRVDLDGDASLIVYGSDEYTAISGPHALDADQRAVNTVQDYTVIFPTAIEVTSETWYRIVLLPTSATNILIYYLTFTDDGATAGITASLGGSNFVYTYRNGAPSSGDHAWTDSTTIQPGINLLIDGIDTGAAAGGLLRHPGMQGGLNA